MEIQLKIAGNLLILLAAIHVGFPKKFNWNTELIHLSLINRQMMKVHTLFIAITVFLMGLLCVCCTDDLIHTPLGQKISLGLGTFWTLRMFIQFFGYSSALWKGKVFETSMHMLFSACWIYLSVLFMRVAWPVIENLT